jgi:hypothetical protein
MLTPPDFFPKIILFRGGLTIMQHTLGTIEDAVASAIFFNARFFVAISEIQSILPKLMNPIQAIL